MTRVATIPNQRILFGAIGKSQQKLAETQIQMATGKKAQDFASLGVEAVRNLSARTLVARQEAHGAVAKRLNTTLAIVDANLGGAEESLTKVRNDILKTVGTGQSTGLQEAIEEAFQRFRYAMNADEGGLPLFAGSQTNQPPFQPASLADTIGLSTADAFTNDNVKAAARVADGLNVEYGIVADEIGARFFEAFRTIAEAGTIDNQPTAAQLDALNDAVALLDEGLKTLRTVNGENGRRRAQIETLETRAEERTLLLKELISENEDADLSQVASELVQRRTTLEASYQTFARLSGLSLVNFLR
ncbi:flagellin [Sphingomonas changnyeongensis]|uniref:Flagellin n=1 Tax=Sphingomonas changnyeongensis TaxID=2698679 RepID=A0A7Z2NTU3_9SPHN|nr:flagellin [Sphingomonas changnyeongensis]QHL89736.1 flagellin [Sphingomonas changnyeongensis]